MSIEQIFIPEPTIFGKLCITNLPVDSPLLWVHFILAPCFLLLILGQLIIVSVVISLIYLFVSSDQWYLITC